MKRTISTIISVLFLLGLLTGCQSSRPDGASGETVETTTNPAPSVTEIPSGEVEVTIPKEGLDMEAEESDITIGETGGIRVTYSGNISSVRYITSREQLPDYPELQGYDDAYFQEHALLLVMETVTSGSIQVGIGGVTLEGDAARVRLSHEAQGEMGTAVMTTWLLWAEVESGLSYTWSVGNPAVESEAQQY